MMTSETPLRIKTQCHCGHIGSIPRSWLGTNVNCCECKKCYVAIEYLPRNTPIPPGPETIAPESMTSYPIIDNFSLTVFVIGFFVLMYSVVRWVWF